VDPVDGTIPFSHGVPTFAFSLALVVDGESQLGVVYDPMLDRLFVAEKGQGATMNGKPIHVSSAETFDHQAITIDGPWGVLGNKAYTLPQAFKGKKVFFTKFSSMVYGGTLVALGEFGLSVCNAEHPWDIAALKVIIEEAGGRVTDLHGKEQRYDGPIDGAIMSNGLLHDKLVEIVQRTVFSE
jgi:fructose-1,6-bisphosphatase/inositol monophosphatase family enzyme